MARVIEAKAIISAVDRTGGTFNAVAEKLRRMQAAARSASSAAQSAARIGSTAERAGRIAHGSSAMVASASGKALGAVGAAYGATQAIKRNAEVELSVTRMGITADATDEQISGMLTNVRNLAFATGKSFDEVAGGLDSLVSGGQDLPEALKALPAIAKTAQAAGAEMKDMSTTSLALNQALGISADKMQSAFDIMVTGGKEGKFELKDMAQYFASLAPQAATLGLKGEAGLQRMVALLQTIRTGTGTAEEAASGFRDLMSKMETDETFNKFKKFGVDIRKELAGARKEGKDLFETFVEAARKATKGDLSKLPQLLGDLQGRTAVLALMSYGDVLEKIAAKLRNATGAVDRDAARIGQTSQIALNKLSESFDRLQASGGAALSKIVSGDMDAISSLIETGFSSGMVAGFKDFLKKIQPTEDNNPFGQITAAATNAAKDVVKDTVLNRDHKGSVIEAQIRAEEERERSPRGIFRSREPLDERLRSNPTLQRMRLNLFDEQQRMRARSQPALPLQDILTPADRERFEEVERERRRGRALSDMRQPVPIPMLDPRKRASGFPAFGDDSAGRTVEARLTGEADVKGEATLTVKIEAPELIRAYHDAQRAISVVGQLRANGPGSTGTSSPDARPGTSGIGSR